MHALNTTMAQILDSAAQRGDAASELRIGASRVGQRTVEYIQEEPVKSVLLAAAAGAALALLLRLAGASRR